MLSIAICDDNNAMCEYLLRLVKKQSEGSLVDVYHSGSSLLAAGKVYDMYFLDIQMPGISGMQAAQKIREKQDSVQTPANPADSVIIFISALKEYMQDAFDVRAFHFLLKPVGEQKFTDVFRRAQSDLQRRKRSTGKYILIKSGDSHYKIFLKDIAYIESRDRKNIIYTTSGVKEYYGKLKELENTLGGAFFRCHRSYIVNMEHIARYNADTIMLEGGGAVHVAQKKYQDFVKAYMLFARDDSKL